LKYTRVEKETANEVKWNKHVTKDFHVALRMKTINYSHICICVIYIYLFIYSGIYLMNEEYNDKYFRFFEFK